ncbi:Ribosome-binding protein aMBF1 translation factor containing Zn-ribbon and HTH domain [Methanonatronarchaeum thermophilum]|uniref:Ribosome-binding protein aMBF1 translation factor containing Zn-ribbon and HTH domain n=1 Tax=Methanonatronarchaeum thermophilum TaxID=1927129 RepID=A0A1Y3GBW3_9EURY|nr:multiprotein bridging factor aMBF1 [Methanonatronarchaeum thermophilum]OUJ18918.1 Ribosome-binding protein aMBF1 translation factor containing Zn-ribbon and HTH domain [Methanonatronarchaeum thermophilum]
MQCEICGKDAETTVKVRVEGSEMQVCLNCKSLGQEIQKKPSKEKTQKITVKKKTSQKRKSVYDEMDQIIPDYGEAIKNARENKGLTQDELADKINEKSSVISKLENEKKLPEEKVIKKLESFLEIKLRE